METDRDPEECCRAHVSGPKGSCCDPDTCEPCCASCPTCPSTTPAPRRRGEPSPYDWDEFEYED